MESPSLEKISEELKNLKKEVADIKVILEEDFDVSKGVVKEIKKSRKRPIKKFISHEDMKKEFS